MVRALKKIAKHVNLDNPNEVLDYIARKKAMDSYKANLCDFYKHYADYRGIPFTKPKYRRDHKLLTYLLKKSLISLFLMLGNMR